MNPEVLEEIKMAAATVRDSLLPTKSRMLYEETYKMYRLWCTEKKLTKTDEDGILAYFSTELSKYKSSSLWTKYSMLRLTINLHEGIDISKFPTVIPFLKRKADGYKPKKSLILSKEDIEKFLQTAANREHLLNKIVVIFGISGACRSNELVTLSTSCLHDAQTHFLVRLEDTKTKKDRSFVILPGSVNNVNFLELIRHYMALRPRITQHNRFFVNYIKEKCTVQPVGVHKIGGVPGIVAKYLGLENYSAYTGHCFRRTSATLLANSGAHMDEIKRHGGWRSSTVAEGYIQECEMKKISVAKQILGGDNGENELPVADTNQISRKTEVQRKEDEIVKMSISHNNNCVININHHYHN